MWNMGGRRGFEEWMRSWSVNRVPNQDMYVMQDIANRSNQGRIPDLWNGCTDERPRPGRTVGGKTSIQWIVIYARSESINEHESRCIGRSPLVGGRGGRADSSSDSEIQSQLVEITQTGSAVGELVRRVLLFFSPSSSFFLPSSPLLSHFPCHLIV